MAADSHLEYHRQLLVDLRRTLIQQPPFNQAETSDDDRQFLSLLDGLCEGADTTDEGQHPGQQMVTTIITRYPHITPMVPRDLFWFFGGDCLHFLGDEEIALFQQLDEDYHNLVIQDPEQADYAKLRTGSRAPQSHKLN